MLRDLLEPDDVDRFQKEALPRLERLQHPNLVRVYNSGQRGDWLYLVHEFVPGGSLRHRLADQPQPIEESVGLVQSLARTMQVVHDHGLVHGNLEPANVLLADDGTPRIAEVGLVNQPGRAPDRLAEAATGTIALRTSHRNMTNFVGNLRYLAPEVIYSNTGAPSDIYSLGAILYHLLTGRPPFDEASPMRLMAQVFKRDPAPPRQVRPELPPELEAVCLKCLHKEQKHRYASAGALAEDLQRFLGSDALPSESSSFWQSLLNWWKPRRSP
jgi:serine/threonine-protein kinase